MTLEYIYAAFKALETPAEKVEYLRQIASLGLPYDINYENLIRVWLEQPIAP